jgi:lysophospholipase L1-like esterase
MHNRRLAVLPFVLTLVSVFTWAAEPSAPASNFSLRDGDRVVFFGDSITEQRLYTRFTEQYVLTRFPDRKITFFNAGVGGDKVSGGPAGPIDLRLRRDVFVKNPTVVTIMLGMNDGYYRPFDEGVLETFEWGYRHILDSLSAKAPQARVTLIKPSAFDDVTRIPQFDDGYNVVLVKMGAMLENMARTKQAGVADMNTPLVAALAKAKELDPALAPALMFDRIHPGAGIHWIMAAALLKSWNAPAIVSSVNLDAVKGTLMEATNAEVTQLQKNKAGVLAWTQQDRALPLPLPSSAADPIVALAMKSSNVIESLDQQPLRITGLKPGQYELRIDEKTIGNFSAEQLAAGINLATLETPMLVQARLVAYDNDYKNGLEATRFRMIAGKPEPGAPDAARKLEQGIVAAQELQRTDAQPQPHKFTLTPVSTPAAKSTAAAR